MMRGAAIHRQAKLVLGREGLGRLEGALRLHYGNGGAVLVEQLAHRHRRREIAELGDGVEELVDAGPQGGVELETGADGLDER